MIRREWDESEHPRDEDGKFTDAGGGGDDGGGGSSDSEGGKSEADKLKAKFDKLPTAAKTEDGALKVLHEKLKKLDPVFYHESAGDVSSSMTNEGIRQSYGVFAAIGKPSGFVVGGDVKTIVQFKLPKSELVNVGGDMGYHSFEGDLMDDNSTVPFDISPEQGLLMDHPDLIGGWVSVNIENGIPPEWIISVDVVKVKKKTFKKSDGQDRATFMRQCMDEMQDDGESRDDARDICELLWDEQSDLEEEQMKTVHKTNSDRGSTMEFVLSDATPDRYGDVIEASGWDLRNFKKNPIALFNHNSDFPIGRWENLQVKDGALRGVLRMAPAGTSPRIDELRNLMEAGILRAVSVGFRPVEHTRIEGSGGGIRFLKSELLETSLVSVPANPNAIAVAKSLNVSRETIDMIFGEKAKEEPVVVKKTGENASSRPAPQQKAKPMNLAQKIAETQTRITGLRDQLDAHLEGMDHANPSDESQTIRDELTLQIETQVKSLEGLQRAEAAIAKTASASRPVPPVVGDRGSEQPMQIRSSRLFATPEKKIEPLDLLFKGLAVDVKHFGEGRKRPILDVLKENYGDNEVGENVRKVMSKLVTKAAVIPADTTTSGWADTLVQTVIGQFIEALMPFSLYPALRAKAGPAFTFGQNGTISFPARNTATTVAGAFVAQGAPIPVRQGAFTPTTITPRKMGVITTMTREITEHSTPQIETILRQAMLEDTGVAIDTILLDATAGSAIRPAGLKNGISKISATAGGAVPAALIGDLKGLYAALITATAGNVRSPVWIMNPGDVLAASLIQTTTGDTPFREEISRGTLLGIPILQTTTGLSDMMAIMDAADFATATGDTPQFSVSDQAVLHMEDTSPAAISTVATPNTVAAPIRSLWQTDSMAIRMILDINWMKRRAGIFQWTDTMTWN